MIAVINESTTSTDTEVQSWVDAVNKQISRDFLPVWGVHADLEFVADKSPDPAAWQVVILDNSDQAGALGYHDLTAQGLPLGKVFSATTKQYNSSVSVDFSHEVLEMLADPGINRCASSLVSGQFYAWEVCDACEDDSCGYEIDGVLVSDFVFPSWFGGVESPVMDFQKKISRPGQLLEGGYIGVWTPDHGWTQIVGEARKGDYSAVPKAGSRRERRSRGSGKWLLSKHRTAPSVS